MRDAVDRLKARTAARATLMAAAASRPQGIVRGLNAITPEILGQVSGLRPAGFPLLPAGSTHSRSARPTTSWARSGVAKRGLLRTWSVVAANQTATRSTASPVEDEGQQLPIVEAEAGTRPGNGTARVAGDRPPLPRLLYDAAELAELLGVSVRSIRRLDARGELPMPLCLGRAIKWRAEEIRQWCREGCPPRSRWTWGPGTQ